MITAVLALLLLTAYTVSAFRIAFSLIEEKDLEQCSETERKRIALLLGEHEQITLTIFETVILISIGIVFCCMRIADELWPFAADWLRNTGVIAAAYLLITFSGYILPTILVTEPKFGFIRRQAPFVRLLMILFYPFTRMALRIRNLSYNQQFTGISKPIRMDELEDAVEIVSKASTPEDKRILTGMVRFANAQVGDIMCHRTKVVSVEYGYSFAEVQRVIFESEFSRLPVYKESSDTIVGVLYVKDIIAHLKEASFEWQSKIRPPFFVDEEKMVNELLIEFQNRKEHLAIVVDEYGSTLGIVTLEDILEEIVGEINDESDTDEERLFAQISDHEYVFRGDTSLSDFQQALEIDPDELESISGEAESLAGLIIELSDKFPQVGSETEIPGYKLIILSLKNQRINKVKVIKA